MPRSTSGKTISSTGIRATKQIVKDIGVVAGGDCGCVNDEGCCKDKGCCREGKCPAEMPGSWIETGCSGDDFTLKIKNREDLIRDYILQNKASVVQFFKARGVQIGQ